MSETIALVTGAYKGIGFEIARQLAKRGVHVIIGARDEAKARKGVEALKVRDGQAEPLAIDLDNPSSVRQAADAVRARHGRLDVLINNAGIYPDERGVDLMATPPDHILAAFRTNALGTVLVTQAFLPLLEESGRGRIVNVSSGMGALSGMTTAQGPAYSIAKTALNAVTCQFAAALKERGVPVNSMCPGWVKTDMGGGDAPRTPAEGADTAVWLALDAPVELTGQFLRDRKPIEW